ncbi:uncharacterized protein LOC141524676 [Cotesia typhae]|uniref:uncharacterized protein LOC141524676 n=1 Tax=Cotesia typhae TaxID=2053667 RepID=UPI003D68E6DC
MIRITIGLFVCACALIIANAGVLPENLTIETSELSNSTESHLIDKRNTLLDAWEEFKNYMKNFIREWFRKSDEEEEAATKKGYKVFMDILGKICEIETYLKNEDPSTCG